MGSSNLDTAAYPAHQLPIEKDAADLASTSTGKRWSGWQYTILAGIGATAFSLFFNVLLLIIGISRYDQNSGRGQLSAGSCSAVPKLDTAFHLGINILSVLLLGSSNAAMQCLSAPTRKDLDRLHAQGHSADVGLNGYRNLKIMSWLRRVLWALLLLSSVPLHLLYNSAVVTTITSWDWYGVVVTNDFIEGAGLPGADWNHTATNNVSFGAEEKLANLQQLASTNRLVRLDPAQCEQAFSTSLVYGYASVLFVVGQPPYTVPSGSGSVLGIYHSDVAHQLNNSQAFYNVTWAIEHNTLPSSAPIHLITANTNQAIATNAESQFSTATWPLFWNHTQLNIVDQNLKPVPDPSNAPPPPDLSIVDHCLAEPSDDFCTVDTLPAVQAIVVVLNVVKLACLTFILLKLRDHQPLITLGDVVSSYLAFPDPATKGKEPVDLLHTRKAGHSINRLPPWMPSAKRHRWFRGVSPLRWAATALIFLTYWVVGAAVIFYFSKHVSNPLPTLIGAFGRYNLSNQGSGANNGEVAVFGGGTGPGSSVRTTIGSIVFANSFQLGLSVVYFHYNAILTSMVLSREWTNFARYRKGLRVSSPQGAQRGTHRLTLPYSYSIPAMGMASALHWLLSESLFYQEANVFDGGQVLHTNSQGMPQASIISEARDGVFINVQALFLLVAFAAFCMVLMLGLGFRRYAGGIPLVRSNSLALGRACQQWPEHPKDPTSPLAWGIRSRSPDGAVQVGLSSGLVELMDPSALDYSWLQRQMNRWMNGEKARARPSISPPTNLLPRV